MLVVPMKTQKEEIIGVLQLINCKPDLQRRFASPGEIEREVEPFRRPVHRLRRLAGVPGGGRARE